MSSGLLGYSETWPGRDELAHDACEGWQVTVAADGGNSLVGSYLDVLRMYKVGRDFLFMCMGGDGVS